MRLLTALQLSLAGIAPVHATASPVRGGDRTTSQVTTRPEGATAVDAERLSRSLAARGAFRQAADALSAGIEAAARGQDLPNLVRLAQLQVVLCQSAGNAHCEAIALVSLANADAGAGRAEIALRRLQRATDLFRLSGDATAALVARFDAAGARFDLGDVEGALREMHAIEHEIRPLGNTLAINFDLSFAEILIDAGEFAAGLEVAQRVEAEPFPTRASPATTTSPRTRAPARRRWPASRSRGSGAKPKRARPSSALSRPSAARTTASMPT